MSSLKLLGEPAGGGPHTHPEADIEDGTILARLAASETITGLWTFPGFKLAAAIGDSGGTVRITVATASPFITLGDGVTDNTGHTVIQGKVRMGQSLDAIAVDTYGELRIDGSPGSRGVGLLVCEGLAATVPSATIEGVAGLAAKSTDGNTTLCAGLNFEAWGQFYSGTLTALEGIRVSLYHKPYSPAVITNARGIHVYRPVGSAATDRPQGVAGLYIEDQYSFSGLTTPTTVIAIKCDDLSGGTNRYLLELGPATPYLRLIGGAAPGANQTNLYLAEGVTPTLRRAQWKLYSDLVAGDRVMVLV